MAVEIAKITSKGQMTSPKAIREAARLSEVDLVVVEIDQRCLTLRKIERAGDIWLENVAATLEEWSSPEDEAAWRTL
jgi:AbrB family looped-hinge helix DNA binding protein